MKLTRSSLKELIRQSIYELEEGGKGSGRPKGGGALPVGKKKLKHPSGQDQYSKEKLKKDIKKYKKTKNEGGPGSGPGGDEDNPFDKEPSDDELTNIEKELL